MCLVVHILHRIGRVLGALVALAVLTGLLIGVPWGLWHYIGWPLPTHIPKVDEIEATLFNPLSATLLLDILACIAWPTWLTFVIDVARCVPDVMRGIRPRSTGPIHAVAGALAAAILLGLVVHRGTTSATTSMSTTAHLQPMTSRSVHFAQTAQVAFTAQQTNPTASAEPAPGTVIIQSPQAGIHDSLWRIAQRELGDGERWPELFHTNQGHIQADGRALTDPNLVYPGWVLVLPEQPQVPPVTPSPGPGTATPAQPPANHQHNPPRTRTSTEQHAPAPRHHGPVLTTSNNGIALSTGGFVATGLATAVAAAMVIRHRRRLRIYRPGSNDREQPPQLAPVVRALRIVYDQQQFGLDDDSDNSDSAVVLTDTESVIPPEPEAGALAETAVELGVRDDRAQAIDLAAAHGVGVVGPGAESAVRALLVYLLGTTTATVVMPEPDATALLGAEPPSSARLKIIPDLDTAIQALGNRLRPANSQHHGIVALVASAHGQHARLQSLLDNGGSQGIIGILLGHWPAGGTVRVRADGTVAAASPQLDPQLHAARLFHIDATDTRDLIDLFSAAAPTPVADTPPFPEPNSPREERPIVRIDGGPAIGQKAENEPVDTGRNPPDDTTPAAQNQLINIGFSATQPQQESTVESLTAGSDPSSDHQLPLALTLFGPLRLRRDSADGEEDLTDRLAPKHKALIAFLALRPDGTTREAVRATLWPNATGRRPYNPLYATLSQIRKTLVDETDEPADELIAQHGEQIALNPSVVDVDYWHLYNAEHDARTAVTDDQRVSAWSRIAAVYTGELADGMSALWLDGPRQDAHRSVVDALAGMAASYRGNDPQRQLQLLEHARMLNPENENIYRDIMRTQAELGLTDAISRTLQLLTTALANIGDRPDPSTLTLARALQAREHHRAAAS